MVSRYFAILLFVAVLSISIACGGGGDKTPSASFRTLLSAAQAIKGQYVVIEVQLSDFPTNGTWTLFSDTDLDYPNGATHISDGSSSTIEALLDTTNYSAGSYYVGISITVGESSYVFHAKSQVVVVDGTAPEVSITSPASGGQFEIGTNFQIDANCSDWTGFEIDRLAHKVTGFFWFRYRIPCIRKSS